MAFKLPPDGSTFPAKFRSEERAIEAVMGSSEDSYLETVGFLLLGVSRVLGWGESY